MRLFSAIEDLIMPHGAVLHFWCAAVVQDGVAPSEFVKQRIYSPPRPSSGILHQSSRRWRESSALTGYFLRPVFTGTVVCTVRNGLCFCAARTSGSLRCSHLARAATPAFGDLSALRVPGQTSRSVPIPYPAVQDLPETISDGGEQPGTPSLGSPGVIL